MPLCCHSFVCEAIRRNVAFNGGEAPERVRVLTNAARIVMMQSPLVSWRISPLLHHSLSCQHKGACIVMMQSPLVSWRISPLLRGSCHSIYKDACIVMMQSPLVSWHLSPLPHHFVMSAQRCTHRHDAVTTGE